MRCLYGFPPTASPSPSSFFYALSSYVGGRISFPLFRVCSVQLAVILSLFIYLHLTPVSVSEISSKLTWWSRSEPPYQDHRLEPGLPLLFIHLSCLFIYFNPNLFLLRSSPSHLFLLIRVFVVFLSKKKWPWSSVIACWIVLILGRQEFSRYFWCARSFFFLLLFAFSIW